MREITLAGEAVDLARLRLHRRRDRLIGILFLVVGVITSPCGPYEPASWALLSRARSRAARCRPRCCPSTTGTSAPRIYFLSSSGSTPIVPIHTALAFPAIHPRLARRATIWAIYAVGAMQAAFNLLGGKRSTSRWLRLYAQYRLDVMLAASRHIRPLSRLAMHTPIRWSRSARASCSAGAVSARAVRDRPVPARGLRQVSQIDSRFPYLAARHVRAGARAASPCGRSCMNARIAVRRAVLYTGAVAVLTVVALLLSPSGRTPWPCLLFPLLYLWPRFDARLNRRLYPQRAPFSRAAARDRRRDGRLRDQRDAVLDVLAQAPRRDSATRAAASRFCSPRHRRHRRSACAARPAATPTRPDCRRAARRS